MASKQLYNVTYNFDKFLENENIVSKKETIDNIILSYYGKPGSLIPVLQKVQETIKYLPSVVQDYIAKGLNLSASNVFGVVSFYSFFTMVPRGEFVIKVCLGTACYVKGANKIVQYLENGLEIKAGGTTNDRKFSLDAVRCLGACGLAPVVLVNEDTYGMVEPVKSMDLLKPYS